jgi:hypothetical protein
MKPITELIAIAAFTFAFGALAVAGPKAERAHKYFTVTGQVIQIDTENRTLLVAERLSKKLYLIEVPPGATFKITFGRYMQMKEPAFGDVRINERIEIRCVRGETEHLSQLEDGRVVIKLTVAS